MNIISVFQLAAPFSCELRLFQGFSGVLSDGLYVLQIMTQYYCSTDRFQRLYQGKKKHSGVIFLRHKLLLTQELSFLQHLSW